MHAAAVELLGRRAALSPRDPPDPLVLDSLSTGDIVLFARSALHEHLPMALALHAYHALNRTDTDHAGVVVLDEAGTPYLLEATPFRGLALRKLEDQLLASRALQICVVPLLPRRDYSGPERADSFAVLERWASRSSWLLSEAVALPLGVVASLLSGLGVPLLAHLYPHCPSASLVLTALRSVGCDFRHKSKSDLFGITCNDILARDLVDARGRVSLDASTVMVRMR